MSSQDAFVWWADLLGYSIYDFYKVGVKMCVDRPGVRLDVSEVSSLYGKIRLWSFHFLF